MEMITYRQALHDGLYHCLKNDTNTILLGEDVGRYGGSYSISKGMLEEFGNDRIRDTPLSESAFTGIGIGASIGGLRPIVEIMTVNFSLLALDQIVHNAATLKHMSGDQINIPLIIRMTTGAGRQLAAQHSHDFSGWFAHIPGLTIITPATITDARFMIEYAIKLSGPVLIFEQAALFNDQDEIEAINNFDIFKAKVMSKGEDLTIITFGASLKKCLEVASNLSKHNISIEVIDLRCLRPLDNETIFKSVNKTKKAIIVDEGWKSGGISAEISTRIHENLFEILEKPVLRVASLEIPIPYNKELEQQCIPNINRITNAVIRLLNEDY